MKKVETNRALFDEVPTDITLIILSRLPTKTCLNCKLVCKNWYHIIISREFADLRSSQCSYLTVLLFGMFNNKGKSFMLLDIDKSSKVDEEGNLIMSADAMINFKPNLKNPYEVFVVNECNGLVLLRSFLHWNSIYNLVTGEQVSVNSAEQCNKPSWDVVDYVLGCCPISQKFKLLRLLKTVRSLPRVAEIQTLGTNEWRTVGYSPVNSNPLPLQTIGRGAFLHGSLHWYSAENNHIWGFHFEKEQFFQVPTPDDMKRDQYKAVGVFDSCLCFSSLFIEFNQCEIWMMKEYEVKDSWVKQFVVQTNDYYAHACTPLFQMGTGEILFSYAEVYSLGVCDIESQSWKKVKVNGVSTFKAMAPCHIKFSMLQASNDQVYSKYYLKNKAQE